MAAQDRAGRCPGSTRARLNRLLAQVEASARRPGASHHTALDAVDLEDRPALPIRRITVPSPAGHSALGRWRAAVGPARCGSATRPVSSAVPARAWPLAVAAWNTQVGGGAILALWDCLTQGQHADRPTVLLLQEAFAAGPHLPPSPSRAAWASRIAPVPPGEPRTDIVSFARETGLSLVYVPSMRNGHPAADPPEDRGNAILANVPLSSPRAIELPFERQRRVAVTANVTIADTTIALCSVHLDNRSPWRRAWQTLGGARRRQMAGLLDVFPKDAHADAHVLGGDFNTWVGGRREGAYRLARARLPLPTRPDPKPTHHFEIGGWLRHSDHLMFRLPSGWHGEYHRLDDTFGSDHYPLVGTVDPALSSAT